MSLGLLPPQPPCPRGPPSRPPRVNNTDQPYVCVCGSHCVVRVLFSVASAIIGLFIYFPSGLLPPDPICPPFCLGWGVAPTRPPRQWCCGKLGTPNTPMDSAGCGPTNRQHRQDTTKNTTTTSMVVVFSVRNTTPI